MALENQEGRRENHEAREKEIVERVKEISDFLDDYHPAPESVNAFAQLREESALATPRFMNNETGDALYRLKKKIEEIFDGKRE